MKTTLALMGLSASVVLLGAFAASPDMEAPSPAAVVVGNHYKIVRAEYVDLAGNNTHVETECFVTNTSAVGPVTIREVYVLGPGGVGSVITTHTGLFGVTVPPLGQVRFDVHAIPGVTPQTTWTESGVRSVVVAWTGPGDALQLTSVIERYRPSSPQDRAHVQAEGYAITF